MGPLYPWLLGFLLLFTKAAIPDAAAEESNSQFQKKLAGCAEGLYQDLDPFSAERFLKDLDMLDYLKRTDPDRLAKFFSQATQLKDLYDLLDAHDNPGHLNQALQLRFLNAEPGSGNPVYFGFSSKPRRLLEWDQKYVHIYDDEGGGSRTLKQALWEWEALSDKQRKWLSARNVAQEPWKDYSFPRRREVLKNWAKATYADLMMRVPRSREEINDMWAAEGDIRSFLDDSPKEKLWERMGKIAAAVDGIHDLEKRAEAFKDPGLQALLNRAEHAASVDDSLAALGRIFDKLGIPNRSVAQWRPAAADEEFSEADRARLESLLTSRLLSEIGSVETGRHVVEFYQTHALKIRVKNAHGAFLGQYLPDTQELVFDEKAILQWLKAEKRRPRDLATDPKTLWKLATLLAPTFVHEATHQEQHAWAVANGIPFWSGQHIEMEATLVHALYVAQRSRTDPRYKAFLEGNENAFAKSDAYRGQELWRDSYELRRAVITDLYADNLSLDGVASSMIQNQREAIRREQAELQRRSALPMSAQKALEKTALKDWPRQVVPTYADFVKDISQVRTSLIEKDLEVHLAECESIMAAYQKHRGRHQDVIRDVMKGLKDLRAAGRPAQKKTWRSRLEKILVPSPHIGKEKGKKEER